MWSHVYVSNEFFIAQNNRIENTSQPYTLNVNENKWCDEIRRGRYYYQTTGKTEIPETAWQMVTANAREMATANYTQRRVFPVESKIRVLFCPRVGPWRDAMYNVVRLSYCQTTALRGFVIYSYNKNNKQSSYLHSTCGFAAFFTVVLSQSKDSESKTLHTFIFVNTRCMHTFESVVTRSLPRTSELPNSHFFY